MNTQRIFYLDYLRLWSVTAVIVGHAAGSVWSAVPVLDHDWGILTLYTALIRFCIPVLLMISGALFLNERKALGLRLIYTKYLPRIVLVFLFWSALYACFSTWVDGGGGRMFVVRLFTGHYHLWYLYAIGFLYVITPFLRKIATEKRLCQYFIALWFVALTLTTLEKVLHASPLSAVLSKASIQFVTGYTGYFMVGYYLHTAHLTKRVKAWIYGLAIFGFFATFFCTYAASILSALPYDVFLSNYSPFVALFGAGVFLYCKETYATAKSGRLTQAVFKLSPYCFGVYLVHDLFLTVLRHFGITPLSFYPLLSVPILTVVIWLLSFATVYFLRKIPFLQKML